MTQFEPCALDGVVGTVYMYRIQHHKRHKMWRCCTATCVHGHKLCMPQAFPPCPVGQAGEEVRVGCSIIARVHTHAHTGQAAAHYMDTGTGLRKVEGMK